MPGNNDYATKADLKALRDELKGDMAALRNEIKADMAALEQRLTEAFQEAIHETETHLLKAFYGFAEATQKHLAENERNIHGVSERLTIVEQRVTEIEKRLNFPSVS